MNHKEMTKHIRQRIKVSKIKARVRLYKSCGVQWIQVFEPEHNGGGFTAHEAQTIATIARVNGLTFARGTAIDASPEAWEFGTNKFDFEYREAAS